MVIKAYTDYNEWSKTHYYTEFEVFEYLPEVENLEELMANTKLTTWMDNDKCVEITEVNLDREQPNDKVYDYNFYELTIVDIADYHNDEEADKDIGNYMGEKYVCVRVPEEEYEDIKEEGEEE